MKPYITIIPMLLGLFYSFTQHAYGQERQIVKSKYTVIDSDSRRYNGFFSGNKGEIRFNLVQLQNLTTEESLHGVEIDIETKSVEEQSSSIAFGSIASLWGVSSRTLCKTLFKVNLNRYVIILH